MLTLAQLPLLRAVRSPRGWLVIAGWIAFAIAGALLARRGGAVRGADHALLGAYGAVALPLLVYGVVAVVLGGHSLARSGTALVTLGASPYRVALATLGTSVAISALLGGLLALAVGALAHGSADPPLVRDLVVSAEVGALGGAAYAAYFTLGASFGARGLGRSVLLVIDWVFGVGRGASAVLTPRAHVRSLLGGMAPLDMTARGSFVALAVLVVVCGAIAVRRAGRAQWMLPRP
jgi:hypothetical protein